MKNRLLSLLLFPFLFMPVMGQMLINELMQSNIDCIMDDLNEFPDSWVELYNTTGNGFNLKGYSLGLTNQAEEAWPLPETASVGPHRFVLIYCDKEATGSHTDFRLESGKGGSLYLFHNGEVIDSVVSIPKQPAPNISYGRKSETGSDAEVWGFQSQPTPKNNNSGKICSQLLGDPVFSLTGRVIIGSERPTVTLSLPDDAPAGTQIRYTLNGKEPTATSTLYTGSAIRINQTTILRATLLCDGYLSPRSTTQSYILFPRNLTLPVVSIVTDQTYLTDAKKGIYVAGTYNSSKKNYEYDWRRPINIEFFDDASTDAAINQLCETRISGAASRGCSKKSLTVYANKRFGKKRIKYEFFADRPGVDEFKSIILRNAGNDFDYLYMRDALIQRVMATHTDLDWQAWRPAIVYINGEYTGMLNIRERSTADNIYTNYDGLEDIDMIENWWDVKEGSWSAFEAFQNFYTEHGHTWEEYEEVMDCHEFMNLMLMNLYFDNVDFPGNNIIQWRPSAEGGRWRWVAKDTDYALGLYGGQASANTIAWINDPNYDPSHSWANGYDHTRLFRRLMEVEQFQREFIDRAGIYTCDFLNYDKILPMWQEMYDEIAYEYPNHRKLINQWWPNYNDELNNARNWLKKRTDYFIKYMTSYYQLPTACPLVVGKKLESDEQQSLAITVNDIPVTTGTLDGKFWPGRTLQFSAEETEDNTLPAGQGVIGWKVEMVDPSTHYTSYEVEGRDFALEMPECLSLNINPIIGDLFDPIEAVSSDSHALPVEYYDLNGMRRSGMSAGQNILRMSDGTWRKIGLINN